MNRRKLLGGALLQAATGAAAPAMQLETTSRWTHALSWPGGKLELNLVPMNPNVPALSGIPIGYVTMRPDVSLLLPVADLVGIVDFQLAGLPRVPRILWDNREHQFWDDFEGSFEPRNAVVNEPQCERRGDLAHASYYYIANHVKTTIAWDFSPPSSPRCKANWTTTITVENRTGATLRNYLQFFACYHLRATNYYWDASNQIKACTETSFNGVSGPAMKERLVRSPYTRHKNRNLKGGEVAYLQYAKPVILSGKEQSFGGMRHVIMIEPRHCASLATWYQQARDYTLCPAGGDLKAGDSFKARIRHVIAPVDGVADLESLWSDFERNTLQG